MIEEIKNFSLEADKEALFELGGKIVFAVAVLVAVTVLKKILFYFMFRVEKGNKLDRIHIPVLKSILKYVIYILAALIILDIFGINTTGLLAVLGAAGLAVGLALKDTLGNIAAGFMLLFVKPFGLGDYIEAGSVSGSVEEITLFITTLRTADGQYVSVPNALVLNNAIKNYTRNKTRRMRVPVRIAHRESVDRTIEVLKSVAVGEHRFEGDPAPQVVITDLAETGTQMELRGWVKTAEYWDILFDLNKAVKQQLARKGIAIAVPLMEMEAPVKKEKPPVKRKNK